MHCVITEYAAVDLLFKNIRQRAMYLISFAHPEFRQWIPAEAKPHGDTPKLRISFDASPRDSSREPAGNPSPGLRKLNV